MVMERKNLFNHLWRNLYMNNCFCNLFDDNGSIWIIIIALLILFCCCGC